MDELIKFIFSGENLRTILILASVVFSFGLISMKMDKRFMQVEKSFMSLKMEMNNRFTEVDRRFMDIDKRFITLESDMNGRFTALEADMNGRFAALEADMKERFAAQEAKFNEAIDKKLDRKFEEFYERLKTNDFDHINRAIEALTFTLTKNGTITEPDKKFVERHLDL